MCLNPIYLRNSGMLVGCGQCVECKQASVNEWVNRLLLEKKSHKDSCFITLTYNDDNLPTGSSLSISDYQKFLKRLRKHLSKRSKRVRYFLCGEYGSKGKRPHYHAIIFGWCPDDLQFFKNEDGVDLFRSATLESLWTLGFSTVGKVSQKTCRYCAKYMQKSFYDKNDKRLRPFVRMSKKPIIGFDALFSDSVDLLNDKIYVDGKSKRIPRAFLNYFEKSGFQEFVLLLKEKRLKNCFSFDFSNFESYEQFLSCYNEYCAEIENRRKKISEKFGKNLDNKFRVVYDIRNSKTMRKTF